LHKLFEASPPGFRVTPPLLIINLGRFEEPVSQPLLVSDNGENVTSFSVCALVMNWSVAFSRRRCREFDVSFAHCVRWPRVTNCRARCRRGGQGVRSEAAVGSVGGDKRGLDRGRDVHGVNGRHAQYQPPPSFAASHHIAPVDAAPAALSWPQLRAHLLRRLRTVIRFLAVVYCHFYCVCQTPSQTQINGQRDTSIRLFLCLSGVSILRVDEARCFVEI